MQLCKEYNIPEIAIKEYFANYMLILNISNYQFCLPRKMLFLL